jgi:hypothetical protein
MFACLGKPAKRERISSARRCSLVKSVTHKSVQARLEVRDVPARLLDRIAKPAM